MTSVKQYKSYGEKLEHNYTRLNMEMSPDFSQPEFYKDLFKIWGLDVPE